MRNRARRGTLRAMNVTDWWERIFIVSTALDRNPADKLAFRELRALNRMKDELIGALGYHLGYAVISQCYGEGIPQ